MADPVLSQGTTVATRYAVAADVVRLEVRRANAQHVPHPDGGGEAAPTVGRIRWRMRSSVEVDRALRVVKIDASVDRRHPLGQRIVISRHPHVGQPAVSVVGRVLPALVFTDGRYAVGVVAVGAQARRVVDGEPEVVGQLGSGQPLGSVFVIDGHPGSGEIDLLSHCRGRGRDEQN